MGVHVLPKLPQSFCVLTSLCKIKGKLIAWRTARIKIKLIHKTHVFLCITFGYTLFEPVPHRASTLTWMMYSLWAWSDDCFLPTRPVKPHKQRQRICQPRSLKTKHLVSVISDNTGMEPLLPERWCAPDRPWPDLLLRTVSYLLLEVADSYYQSSG